ncbi:hypothetical protein CHS0354_003496 [Potamilus streckersoni]|uniref:Uncharacterized protein n=1 Tax=Potamilus streckersoni TaxID=2493646 RepID=A0AAE0SZF6_9BIVA|nr:hypothetical protein CHS0354_003496 [Potamilus streckersoni]
MEKATFAVFLLCFAFICMVIAFATPYWVESFAKSGNQFVKCGLWEFCFNDYIFYKDYNSKRFLGCFYIFDSKIRNLWEWLSPPWFVACEVMAGVSLLFQCLTLVVASIAYWRCLPPYFKKVVYQAAMGVCMGIVALILITLIVYGVGKEYRSWMPRPDQNYLSWGYGLFAISGIVTLFAGVAFWVASKTDIEKDLY